MRWAVRGRDYGAPTSMLCVSWISLPTHNSFKLKDNLVEEKKLHSKHKDEAQQKVKKTHPELVDLKEATSRSDFLVVFGVYFVNGYHQNSRRAF